MAVKSVVESVAAFKGKINPRYGMNCTNMQEIYKVYGGTYEAISVAFEYGYLQGIKAATSDIKKQKECILQLGYEQGLKAAKTI